MEAWEARRPVGRELSWMLGAELATRFHDRVGLWPVTGGLGGRGWTGLRLARWGCTSGWDVLGRLTSHGDLERTTPDGATTRLRLGAMARGGAEAGDLLAACVMGLGLLDEEGHSRACLHHGGGALRVAVFQVAALVGVRHGRAVGVWCREHTVRLATERGEVRIRLDAARLHPVAARWLAGDSVDSLAQTVERQLAL